MDDEARGAQNGFNIDLLEQKISGRWQARRERQQGLEERLLALIREETHACMPICISPKPPSPPKTRSNSALAILLGDSHTGQKVKREATHGLGNYSLRVFCERLHHLEQKILTTLESKIGPPIDEAFIIYLGDMIHGVLQHDAEREPTALVVHQLLIAWHVFHQFILSLGQAIPKITVAGVCGNHGRLPHLKKNPIVNQFSNFDHVLNPFTGEAAGGLRLPSASGLVQI